MFRGEHQRARLGKPSCWRRRATRCARYRARRDQPAAAAPAAGIGCGSTSPPSMTMPAAHCWTGLRRAELEVAVWDMTTDVGVPAFQCLLADRSGEIGHIGQGAGCHPAREVALLRALTEAVQVRMTYIVGLARGHLPLRLSARHLGGPPAQRARPHAARSRRCATSGDPRFRFEDFEAEVAWIWSVSRPAGVQQAIAVDLTRPEFGVPVVRVVVPGLEGSDHTPTIVPGARARALPRRGVMTAYLFVGPTLRRDGDRSALAPEAAACRPSRRATSIAWRGGGRRRSASSTGTSAAPPPSGTRRSCGRSRRGCQCSAAPAWARCARRSCTLFGMRGVGRIFEAFRDGALEDDDEVAVVHGPAETGFVAASEPMVNIRATLARAPKLRACWAKPRAQAGGDAKALFFPHRRLARDACRPREISVRRGRACTRWRWLPGQARRPEARRRAGNARGDAREARPDAKRQPELPLRVDASMGQSSLRRWRPRQAVDETAATSTTQRARELRLQGRGGYGRRTVGGAAPPARRSEAPGGDRARPGSVARNADKECASGSLFSRDRWMAWIARNGLDDGSFERLIGGGAASGAVRWAARRPWRRSCSTNCAFTVLRSPGGARAAEGRAHRQMRADASDVPLVSGLSAAASTVVLRAATRPDDAGRCRGLCPRRLALPARRNLIVRCGASG